MFSQYFKAKLSVELNHLKYVAARGKQIAVVMIYSECP